MVRRPLWILDNDLTIQGAIRDIKDRQDGEVGHETLQLFIRRSGDGNKKVQVRTINFKEQLLGSRANEASDRATRAAIRR